LGHPYKFQRILRLSSLTASSKREGKEEYLYSAFSHQSTHKALRHGSHSFSCKQYHACLPSSSGRQPNFAALNRGRHLCSAGRPSGWALAHILVELFSIALTVEALQGTTCQDSMLSGEGRPLGAKISGEGVVPGEYFLVSTKLDNILLSDMQTASCYVPSF